MELCNVHVSGNLWSTVKLLRYDLEHWNSREIWINSCFRLLKEFCLHSSFRKCYTYHLVLIDSLVLAFHFKTEETSSCYIIGGVFWGHFCWVFVGEKAIMLMLLRILKIDNAENIKEKIKYHLVARTWETWVHGYPFAHSHIPEAWPFSLLIC